MAKEAKQKLYFEADFAEIIKQYDELLEKWKKQLESATDEGVKKGIKDAISVIDKVKSSFKAGGLDAKSSVSAINRGNRAISRVNDITGSFIGSSDELKKLQKELEKITDKIAAENKKLDESGVYTKNNKPYADVGKYIASKRIKDKEGNLITTKTALSAAFKNQNFTDEFKSLGNSVYKDIAGLKNPGSEAGKFAEWADKEIKVYNEALKAKEEQAKLQKQINEKIKTELEHLKAEGAPAEAVDVQKAGQSVINTGNQLADSISSENRKDKQEKAAVDNVTDSVQKQDNVVTKAVKSFISYRLILSSLRKVCNEAIRALKEIDESLTTQAMVSGKTRQETQALLKNYQELAGKLGTTATEVANVATQYIRQGKSVNEALKLTESAVSAAKVAGISTAESVDYLTTAINGFNMSADEAITVSDKFAALAAQSATSYDELATALSKVASQANLAGMSMDFTLGLLAKGVETTRESAESIGTALKTVIARMREMTDYGETLQDGTDFNNVETQLRYVGIALKDSNGELRSTEDVLNDIGMAWDTFSANQQAAIAKALAGTRQQSRLIAMMSDYDRTLQLVQASAESEGATLAQLEVYTSGLSAAINRLTNAWQSFSTTLISSDAVIGLFDTLSNIVQNLEQNMWLLIWAGAAYVVVLAAEGSISLYATKAKIKEVAADKKLILGKWKLVLATLAVKLGLISEATAADLAAKTTTKAGTKMFLAGLMAQAGWLPVVLIMLAIVAVVGLVVAACIILFNKQESAIEKNVKAIANLQNKIYELKKANASIETNISTFDKLDRKVIKTKDDIEAMNEALEKASQNVTDDQLKAAGITRSQLDAAEGNELKEYLEKIYEKNQEVLKASRKEQYDIFLSGGDVASRYQEFKANNQESTALIAMRAKLRDNLDDLKLDDTVTSIIDDIFSKTSGETLVSALMGSSTKYLEDLNKIVNTFNSAVDVIDGVDDITALMSSTNYSAILDTYKELEKTLGSDNLALKSLTDQYPLIDNLKSLTSETVDLITKMGLSADTINDFHENILKFNEKYGTSLDYIALMQDYLNGKEWSEITAEIKDLDGAVAELTNDLLKLNKDTTNTVVNNVDKLKSTMTTAIKTQAEWADMTETDRINYIEEHPELFDQEGFYDAFISGRDISGYFKTALEDDANAYEQELRYAYKHAMENGETALAAQYKSLADSISSGAIWQFSMEELETLVDREQEQIDIYKEMLTQQNKDLTDSLEKRKNAYQKYFDAINKAYDAQDYDKEKNRLQSQLTKLAGATDAASLSKINELTNKLTDLEDQKDKDDRKAAQEALISDIDDQINDANESLEELTSSNAEMLKQIQALQDTSHAFLAAMMGSYVKSSGMTNNQAQQWLAESMATLGIYDVGTLGSADTSDVSNGNTQNYTYNFNGQTITLSSAEAESIIKIFGQAASRMGITTNP